MTTIQTSAEPLPLDPATLNTMLRSTIEALPQHPHATAEARAERCDAAFFAISALRPRDPLEAMQAARIVTLHYHAMYNLACCLQPNTPSDLQLRCQGRGESLGRQSDKMLAEYLHNHEYLHNQQTNPARRPAGLPASAAVAPEPQPQPAPQAADPTEAPPTARATPQPAPTVRPGAAPPARPLKAPVPTRRSGDATPLDQAALEQMLAKAEARLQTSAVALAA